MQGKTLNTGGSPVNCTDSGAPILPSKMRRECHCIDKTYEFIEPPHRAFIRSGYLSNWTDAMFAWLRSVVDDFARIH